MLTHNFAKEASFRSYVGRNGTTYSAYGNGTFPDETRYSYYTISSSYSDQWTMDVGFGDTPPTKDDIDLADSNYANRKLDISGLSKPTKTAIDVKCFSLIATNNGSENVTVKEVGLFYKTANNNTVGCFGLVARIVLQTPVVIAPGEAYNFIYKITF